MPAAAGGEESGLAVEGVAHEGQEAALLTGEFRHLFAPDLGEVAQHLLLVEGQLGGRTYVEVHVQVTAPGAAQVRDPLAADAQRGTWLGARPYVHGLLGI